MHIRIVRLSIDKDIGTLNVDDYVLSVDTGRPPVGRRYTGIVQIS